MAIKTKRQLILEYLYKSEKPVKKEDIVEKFKSLYYCNSSKHIGDILSRLVNSGQVIRVKNGWYQFSNFHSCKNRQSVILENPNQKSLF